MSKKKTLITILFITTIILFLLISILYKTNLQEFCYKFSLVNTTNEERYESTLDKNEDNITLNVSNSNNIIKLNDSNSLINYEGTSSRNLDFDRNKMLKNIQNLDSVEIMSTESVKYVDSLSEKILIKEETIQGVKVYIYDNITYDIYSNGYKEIVNSIESVEVDSSTYDGNTQSLENEADENIKIYSGEIDAVFNLTNQYRDEVGVGKLILDKDLCLAASVRALEMAYTGNLSHTRPDGARFFVVLKDLGINYNCAGENICDGYKNPESVCKAWKESEGHYKNIVRCKYNKVGIGVAQSIDGKYYWVQIFSN